MPQVSRHKTPEAQCVALGNAKVTMNVGKPESRGEKCTMCFLSEGNSGNFGVFGRKVQGHGSVSEEKDMGVGNG